jgi:diguanylate cyclase (GGDEF)-like protein
MLLDNRTLLFSLMLISGLMALSMAVVVRNEERDGLRKWAAAVSLETLAWLLIALRGSITDVLSITAANIIMASAQGLKLAAIYEYRRLHCPRWQYLLPVALAAALFGSLPYTAVTERLVLGSLFYCFQLSLMLRVLHADRESHTGHAWGLIFYSFWAMMGMLLARGIAAAFTDIEFAATPTSIAPNPIQLGVFICIMSFALMGSLGFVLMIKERSDREIRTLAMTDMLTRIFNRRAFMIQAEKELAAAERSGLPLGFLMIDIDHFKPVNDQYGHAAGDAALVRIAEVLSANLRKQDTLGRYGGEEFCALLPGTDAQGAMALAEKLRLEVAMTRIHLDEAALALTISVGISVWGRERGSSDSRILLDAADQALYQAKSRGRNRCVMELQAATPPRRTDVAGIA